MVTFLTTTTLGATWYLWARTDVRTDLGADLGPILTPTMVGRVWSEPQILAKGLAFAWSALLILFFHEMGHYLACRYYRLPATLPHFLPAPVGIGTFGAFIRIRASIRDKRQLFDVGIAGPLAGFVALLPFLFWGVAHSEPVPLPVATPELPAEGVLLMPGRSLAVELAVLLIHGRLPEGVILDPHPFALAAWFGLLATSLNLLPLGQLDGGHILYAATGALQRRLALPLWLCLGLMGLLWPGWIVWSVIVLVMGLPHPPVHNEDQPLDRRRQVLAWVALAMLLLSFMPVPLSEVAVR